MPIKINESSLSPLREKEFRLYIVARFLYTMSLRMIGTVVAYQLFHLTKSSFSIGLAGLAEFLPVVSLALYAGHVIDRSDKRSLLMRTMLLNSLCVFALFVVTLPLVSQQLPLKLLTLCIYGIIFFTGVIRAFAGPTSNAILAQLVSRDVLQYAANISSSTFLIAATTGHASAGFFIAWFGVNRTFLIIFFYILAAGIVMGLVSRKPIVVTHSQKTIESVKEGLRYVFGHKTLLGAISLDLFAVLFGGAVALIPEIADRILRVGPIGFGWLNAAMDIGSFLMIVTVTLFPLKRHQGQRLFYVVAGFGVCIIVFGFSRVYWLSFIALLIAGMLDGISVIIRSAILQLTTPDNMRGRVSSVNSIFINSSNELGQFESGFTSRIMGTIPAVIFGGAMTLLVVIITWFKAPSLRKFEY